MKNAELFNVWIPFYIWENVAYVLKLKKNWFIVDFSWALNLNLISKHGIGRIDIQFNIISSKKKKIITSPSFDGSFLAEQCGKTHTFS